MAGVRMEGYAESGYGVSIQGFHCAISEFPKKLSELEPTILIAQCESNGYATFLSCKNEGPVVNDGSLKFASFRREPHLFFVDLSHFLKSLKAARVWAMTLSESHGSLGLTLVYESAAEQDSGKVSG